MNINETLRYNIKKIRGDQGLSPARLAERAKVSRSTISRIEAGTILPTLEMVGKIAEALRQSPHRLFEDIAEEP